MRRVAVIGAGMTRFGEHFELGIKDLVPMAVTEAVDSVDKGFDRADVDAAWFGELTTTDGFPSGIFADSCGLLDVPVTRIENVCATGNDAIRNGVYGVASGMLDVVLVAGADKVRESSARGTFWEWMGLDRATWPGTTRSASSRPRTSRCTSTATCTSRRRPVSTWRWWR